MERLSPQMIGSEKNCLEVYMVYEKEEIEREVGLGMRSHHHLDPNVENNVTPVPYKLSLHRLHSLHH